MTSSRDRFDYLTPETRLAIKVGLATTIAIYLAFLWNLQAPYWAGISAFLVTAESIGNSIQKTGLRILCTGMGAGLGLLMCHVFIDQPVGLIFATLIVLVYSIYRGFKDDAFYQWIFTAITCFMVVAELMTTGRGSLTWEVGVYRIIEITLGASVGLLVSIFLFPVRAHDQLEKVLRETQACLAQYYLIFMNRVTQPAAISAGDDIVWISTQSTLKTLIKSLTRLMDASAREVRFSDESRFILLQDAQSMLMLSRRFLVFSAKPNRYLEVFESHWPALMKAYEQLLILKRDVATQALAFENYQNICQAYDQFRRSGAHHKGRYALSEVLYFHEMLSLHEAIYETCVGSFPTVLDGDIKRVSDKCCYHVNEASVSSGESFLGNADHLDLGAQVSKVSQDQAASLVDNTHDSAKKNIISRWLGIFHHLKGFLKKHARQVQQNRYYWLFATKVSLTLTSMPLLWVGFGLPGASQLGVSMGAVLNLDLEASRKKSKMRIWGCLVGALVSVVVLVLLRVESLMLMLGLVFLMGFVCSYLHNSTRATAYLGTQALVAFCMGTLVGSGPAVTPDASIERLLGIFMGVTLLFVVLEWVWPFSRAARWRHHYNQVQCSLEAIAAQMHKSVEQGNDSGADRRIKKLIALLKRESGFIELLKLNNNELLIQETDEHHEGRPIERTPKEGLPNERVLNERAPNQWMPNQWMPDAKEQFTVNRVLSDLAVLESLVELMIKRQAALHASPTLKIWVLKGLSIYATLDSAQWSDMHREMKQGLQDMRTNSLKGVFLSVDQLVLLASLSGLMGRLLGSGSQI